MLLGPGLGSVVVDLVGWDHPDAVRLRDAQQAELRERYGDDDTGHLMTGDEIVAMIVLREDDEPVACVALRDAASDGAPGVGEVKRLYTTPVARGRGHSRRVMAALEQAARDRGMTRLVLETGVLQPEAIGLYLTLGFRSIPNYGEYVDEPSSRCFARPVIPAGAAAPAESAGSTDRLTIATGDADGSDERAGAAVTWVAHRDDEPVASLTMRAADSPDRVELVLTPADATTSGAGAGRQLLAAAHAAARERGCTATLLRTDVRQPDAVALPLAAGYRPVLPFSQPDGDVHTLWFARPVG